MVHFWSFNASGEGSEKCSEPKGLQMQRGSRGVARREGASRGVALSGDEASAWLADRGWSVMWADGPLRLFADEVRVRELRMARVWHTPLRAARSASGGSEGEPPRSELFSVVDGNLAMTWTEDRVTIPKSRSVLVPTRSGVELESTESTGRVEFSLPHRAPSAFFALPSVGTVLESSDFSRILVALASSVLASPLTPRENGYPQLMNAVEDAALAFLRNAAAIARNPLASSGEAALYSRAIDLIDEEAGDPDFSVTVLAQRLRVSARRVRQVFAAHGSTAHGHIRAIRVDRAMRLLEDRRATNAAERESIARAAGFRTGRAMSASFRDVDE